MKNNGTDASVRLIIPDELRAVMERRGVCEEDLREVISFAESTSDKLMETGTGRLIAHRRIGNITCWAEYAPEGDAYRVLNAYQHRMVIEEESGCRK
jgi:hypothetical protein